MTVGMDIVAKCSAIQHTGITTESDAHSRDLSILEVDHVRLYSCAMESGGLRDRQR